MNGFPWRRFPWGALEFALIAWGIYQLAHAWFYLTNSLDQLFRWGLL